MSFEPRQIVVVLDGPPTPAWQERALSCLARSDVLELVEVRLAGARPRGSLRRAHAAIERHLFAVGPDALAPVCLARGAMAKGAVGPEDALVVWLSEGPLPADEDRDVLYLRHGNLREPAEDAFRRAVLRGVPCVETEAVIRGSGGTTLVQRTVSGARPYSTTSSRDKALWKISAFVCRAAERAPGLDVQASVEGVAGAPPSTVELLARAPWRWARVVAARLLFDRPWRIRLRAHAPEPAGGWRSDGSVAVRWNPGHLYADPLLFAYEGAHHLFCEDMPAGARRAVISHTELHRDGTPSEPPTPVLTMPYHLSYPFVFEHDGEVFMIPETSAQRRVELYRAVEFPGVWRREAVLLDGPIASDATVLAHEGRLWLFVGVAVAHATMLDELHLYYADDPLGPWSPHPLNPIVSDVRCARPAGAVQRWGSRLVRPGQDCTSRYGGAVSFRQIDVLSSEDYAEHEIARLDPSDLGATVRATHTYSSDGSFEAVDLRERELRVRSGLAMLLGKGPASGGQSLEDRHV